MVLHLPEKKTIEINLERDLGFGDDFDGKRQVLEVALSAFCRASMTKMPSSHLLAQLILCPEILVIPKILI